jgi:hypothetical protein
VANGKFQVDPVVVFDLFSGKGMDEGKKVLPAECVSVLQNARLEKMRSTKHLKKLLKQLTRTPHIL